MTQCSLFSHIDWTDQTPLLGPPSKAKADWDDQPVREGLFDLLPPPQFEIGCDLEQTRMALENELNTFREQMLNAKKRKANSGAALCFAEVSIPANADVHYFYKKSRSGNWAKCRLCAQKVSRAARQSHIALAVHLRKAHPAEAQLLERMRILERAMAELRWREAEELQQQGA